MTLHGVPIRRRVDIPCTAAQREAMTHYINDGWETEVVATGGSRYGGKTFTGAHCIGLRRLKYPNTKALCLRTVQRAADLNMGEELKQSFFQPNGFTVGSRRRGEIQYLEKDKRFVFPNGSMIQLGYCLRPNDWEQHLGVQWDDIWFEQAEQFPERVYDRLGGSNRPSNPACTPRILLTFNPGGIGAPWISRRIVSPKTRDRRVVWVKSVVRECFATLERDPSYVLRALNTISDPVLRAQWLYGDWDILSGIYFRMLPETQNGTGTVCKMIPPYYADWYTGVDWGYHDPFASVWVARWQDEAKRAHLHVVAEVYQSGLDTDLQAQRCLAVDKELKQEYPRMHNIHIRMADPSTSTVVEHESGDQVRSVALMWGQNGMMTYPSRRFSRTARWNLIRYLLRHKILTIDPACVNLINEIKSAVRHPDKEDIDQGRCADHALDALAYITSYLFGLDYSMGEPEAPPGTVP